MRNQWIRGAFLAVTAAAVLAWIVTIYNVAPETAAAAPASGTKYASVLLQEVPHVEQKPDFCGEACTEMWLRHLGYKVDQNDVFNVSSLDPALGRGCYSADLATALKNLGFKIGPVWTRFAKKDKTSELENRWKELHADLAAGVPSIVCMHYSDQPQTTEHFRLILGYDAATDEVVYHEPAKADAAYQRMKRPLFLKLWPLDGAQDRLVTIRMRLEMEKFVAPPRAAGYSDADFCQHILALREKLPEGFTLVLQKPFVVLGNDPPDEVKRRAEQTVKWAVDQLKSVYYSKDPQYLLDIWLFKDEETYKKYTLQLFHDEPTTPYGYYSATDRALIMNISTGAGTLVHEIVHPFMAANFPACPSWFNEGLASLYEQCGTEDGKIHGYPNWRLNGLQEAIKAKRVPSFEKLCGTTTNEFYHEDRGTNYSQARYLCYYLQEQGLLVKYYEHFRDHAGDDPTGYKTLQEVLGEHDMAAFKKKWEAYVMKLHR